MAYTRLHWVESTTPLSADNMNNIEDGIEELQAQKVDKVSGKALSDNNYTSEEKTKLAGIAAGAEVNVQSDWNQADSSADDFIKNKPGNASSSAAGFMSAADKAKLDGVEAGAEKNEVTDVTQVTSSGTAANAIRITARTLGDTTQTYNAAPTATATTSKNGLMSATDKTKLNGIATGAEVNQNAFSNVKVGSTTVAADGKTDTLELVAGSNVTLTPDATNDKVTISATNTTYSDATTSTHGLMTAADKTKLNGVATGAEVNQNAFSNVKVGSTTVAADAKTDTLELVAGSNVTLTPDATNDKVTIAASVKTITLTIASSVTVAANSLNTTGPEFVSSDLVGKKVIGYKNLALYNASGNASPIIPITMVDDTTTQGGTVKAGVMFWVYNPTASSITIKNTSKCTLIYTD